MLSVKRGGIKYHFFLVFGMTWAGIEHRSPWPQVNTLPIRLNNRGGELQKQETKM